jgi:transketolase N-terminal domain/subunit
MIGKAGKKMSIANGLKITIKINRGNSFLFVILVSIMMTAQYKILR